MCCNDLQSAVFTTNEAWNWWHVSGRESVVYVVFVMTHHSWRQTRAAHQRSNLMCISLRVLRSVSSCAQEREKHSARGWQKQKIVIAWCVVDQFEGASGRLAQELSSRFVGRRFLLVGREPPRRGRPDNALHADHRPLHVRHRHLICHWRISSPSIAKMLTESCTNQNRQDACTTYRQSVATIINKVDEVGWVDPVILQHVRSFNEQQVRERKKYNSRFVSDTLILKFVYLLHCRTNGFHLWRCRAFQCLRWRVRTEPEQNLHATGKLQESENTTFRSPADLLRCHNDVTWRFLDFAYTRRASRVAGTFGYYGVDDLCFSLCRI